VRYLGFVPSSGPARASAGRSRHRQGGLDDGGFDDDEAIDEGLGGGLVRSPGVTG